MTRLKNHSCWTLLILIVLPMLLFNCAALKNFRTSREVVIENPPYYHGRIPGGTVSGDRVGYFPVLLDSRIIRQFDTDGWDSILSDLNGYLRIEAFTSPLPSLSLSADEGPDIYIGSPGMFGAPISESSYEDREDDVLPMVLYTKDPSVEWKSRIGQICLEQNLDYVIVFYLGISEYMIHQRGLLGKKEIALGTGNIIPVKWLTSLEDPVEVIHLTGVLIDKEGKIRRSGAEGILSAKTASFFESIIGLQNALSDDTISKITSEIYRNDLPGNPLAYKVALQNLTAGLTGRKDLVRIPAE